MKIKTGTSLFKYFFVALVAGLISSCQTTDGVVIPDSLVSIKQTRIAVGSILGPHRTISENGRVYTSQFHNAQLEYLEVTNKTLERFFTRVTVLGARRPYNIVVEVRQEKRDPDSREFIDVGLAESLTVKQAKLIKEALAQGREKDLIVDEGRPF